jgi:alpha-D-xyloside xylohydrolase
LELAAEPSVDNAKIGWEPMKRYTAKLVSTVVLLASACGAQAPGAVLTLKSSHLRALAAGERNSELRIDGWFFETRAGRQDLPATLIRNGQVTTTDGHSIKLTVRSQGPNFTIDFTAKPADVTKWGLSIEAAASEYFTGIMERVVDGPQQLSWASGQSGVLDLHGQHIQMILKPTTSVYAPFYLSSRGYAVFVKGTWPGEFDFAAKDPSRVQISFEGPSFEMKVYTAATPDELVRAHAMDAGPPFLPPKWMYFPWRWRDEHTERATYYDGTPVTGPFNSEVMEDVLMMHAFGIPNGVYWIDRPWGQGRLGYDDFEIDEKRLPNFNTMVRWLADQQAHVMLWIGPFFQGKMEQQALANGYNLPGQRPMRNNYPLVDFTNPEAKAYWQNGVATLVRRGVAGFKLDRSEEGIPDGGPFKVHDGRTLRENRNAYPPKYLKATYDIASQYRKNDDFVLMPRAAYTGSAPYGVFWGGDIGGVQEGLRAEIIAVQRSALMGYPNWGSDTCGYNQQLLEQEVCARWLEFSAFTPIMEVGPTKNVGFWNLPRDPSYDEVLLAVWRVYARLHQRLADYSYAQAQRAHQTGEPIIRPLFLVDPTAPEAWKDWETYQYGPDILLSPVWQKGQRSKQVYLPSGAQWQEAWHPEKTYRGGQTITVTADRYQLPLFIRVGANVDVGDLNREYQDAVQVAKKRPDLKILDAEVRVWFDKNKD